MRSPANPQAPLRNPQRERQLWDDANRNTRSLGCSGCSELSLCGGLHVEAPFFDCLTTCCSRPSTCTKVCRRNPMDFVKRWREVGGFDLGNVPRTAPIAAPVLPTVAPIVFHGNRRVVRASFAAAALPLYRMFDRRNGRPRFQTPQHLRAAFGLAAATQLILTGTDQDPPVERWWKFGVDGRRAIIRALRCADVALCTTPNFSLFLDTPRTDDLHAIKRIALVHAEFQEESLLAALHINGRTERDFERWGNFIAAREEITHLAYEFTTGTGWAGRQEQHAAWLSALTQRVGRPLHLVVRGGTDVLPVLARAFAGVTVLETTSFMKTMNRQRVSSDGRTAKAAPTPEGAPLDDLFLANTAAIAARLGALVAPLVPASE
jgi:hypothetical protein